MAREVGSWLARNRRVEVHIVEVVQALVLVKTVFVACVVVVLPVQCVGVLIEVLDQQL